jgi:phage N-6-adenine-methyltransferase
VGAHDTQLVVTKYTGEVEWHTPAQWVEAARRVLGAIDLDPASSEVAQETVAAKTYFTKEMDGLSMPWQGRVWLNPPYTAGVVDKFVGKLVRHVGAGDVTAAILLVDSRTDTLWFHHAASACQRICFKRGRISFVRPDGAEADAATCGSAFLYFGGHPDVFEDVFAPFGLVVRRV